MNGDFQTTATLKAIVTMRKNTVERCPKHSRSLPDSTLHPKYSTLPLVQTGRQAAHALGIDRGSALSPAAPHGSSSHISAWRSTSRPSESSRSSPGSKEIARTVLPRAQITGASSAYAPRYAAGACNRAHASANAGKCKANMRPTDAHMQPARAARRHRPPRWPRGTGRPAPTAPCSSRAPVEASPSLLRIAGRCVRPVNR